jgi:hypothetical protein
MSVLVALLVTLMCTNYVWKLLWCAAATAIGGHEQQ